MPVPTSFFVICEANETLVLRTSIPASEPTPKEIIVPHRHHNLRSVIQKLSPVESGLT